MDPCMQIMPILTSSCGICSPGLFLEPELTLLMHHWKRNSLTEIFPPGDIQKSSGTPKKPTKTKNQGCCHPPASSAPHGTIKERKIHLTFTALFQAVPGNSQTSSYSFTTWKNNPWHSNCRYCWAWGKSLWEPLKAPWGNSRGSVGFLGTPLLPCNPNPNPKFTLKSKGWVLGLSLRLDLGQINEICPKSTLNLKDAANTCGTRNQLSQDDHDKAVAPTGTWVRSDGLKSYLEMLRISTRKWLK